MRGFPGQLLGSAAGVSTNINIYSATPTTPYGAAVVCRYMVLGHKLEPTRTAYFCYLERSRYTARNADRNAVDSARARAKYKM